MNKTKKLTQGAMMLAIYGALVLIDRITAFWFTELVVLIAPIIVVLYSAMQTFKDGVFLSIGVVIMSFLLGNFNTTYMIYVPVGLITAVAYSFGVSRQKDKRTLLLISIITYVIGELAVNYIVYPIIGFPVKQMIEQYKLSLSEAGSLAGYDYFEIFKQVGINFDNALPIIYIISIMFLGAMEGVLIHIFSIFLLKRFKIKDLGNIDIWSKRPNKVVAYVAFISSTLLYLRSFIDNEMINNILLVLSISGTFVLLYYGYLFVIFFGRIVIRKNISFLVILAIVFMPTLLVGVVCVGFLYGSGPLRNYLENKLNESKSNINHE